MIRNLRFVGLALVACVPLLACKDGCGGGGGAGPSASATASQTAPVVASASASAVGSGRGPRGGPMAAVRATGPLGSLLRASMKLEGLASDKKDAIEKIAQDLHREGPKGDADGGAKGEGARAEMKAMHDDLVLGVKAGKIDTAKMDAHAAAMEKEAKTRQEAEAEALNKLHATLEPAERAKVVAAVREQEEKRELNMKMHERPDAGANRDFNVMRLERYTKDLDLDADQQKKAQALLPKPDPKAMNELRAKSRKHLDAVLADFEKDTFDAKKIAMPDPKLMHSAMDTEVKFLNGFVPLLKPPQRELLAQKIERNAEHGAGRRGGGRGGGHGGDRGQDHDRDTEEEQEE